MRTVNHHSALARARDRDEGAILVIVALVMVALLGVGAMVIDLGAAYVEKRQLQNGADAGALAVAQDCAHAGNCNTNPGIAQNYANWNANDGTSNVDSVCGVGPGLSPCTGAAPPAAAGASGWVRVTTSTRTPDGGNQVDFLLGPVVGSVTGKTLHASATAAWGAMGSGVIMPLIFSVCEWTAMGGSVVNGTFPSGRFYIYFHGVGGTNETGVGHCTPSPAGQDLPGGFGYLANTECVTAIVAGAWVGIEPGNSLPKGCNPDEWMNKEVLIAIFDAERGTGNGAQYHVAGFVGFTLLGYKFQGNKKSPANFKCPAGNGSNVVCLYGEFTRFTTDASGFGGTDYGARVVKMVG